jgi:uncharacterized protein YqgC (DUF456 family)
MKNTMLVLLLIIALVMIFLGAKSSMLPPVLTGIGFILIAVLIYTGNSNNRQS